MWFKNVFYLERFVVVLVSFIDTLKISLISLMWKDWTKRILYCKQHRIDTRGKGGGRGERGGERHRRGRGAETVQWVEYTSKWKAGSSPRCGIFYIFIFPSESASSANSRTVFLQPLCVIACTTFVRTLKIPSTGGRSIVRTHENRARGGRNGHRRVSCPGKPIPIFFPSMLMIFFSFFCIKK